MVAKKGPSHVGPNKKGQVSWASLPGPATPDFIFPFFFNECFF